MVAIVAIPGAAGIAATTLQAAAIVDASVAVGSGGLGAAVALGGTTAASAGAAAATAGTATATAVAGGGAAASIGGLTTAALAVGPLGLVLLGASVSESQTKFDCWKQILHELSSKDSNGRLLKDVLIDYRILNVKYSQNMKNLIIKNIWNENFEIEFFLLPSNKIVAHASKIS